VADGAAPTRGATGVILYALLCGQLPFFEEDVKELYRKIALASYDMPPYISRGACGGAAAGSV
jgi:hypothetical protein